MSSMDTGAFSGREILHLVNMTVRNVTVSVPLKSPLLSDTAEFTFRIIFYVILSCCFDLFGIVANTANIVVFIRLGIFVDGSNVNLFFLSVTDLGCVVTNLLHGIVFCVLLADIPDLPWDPFSVLYLAVGWPHYIFMLASRVLTAYVALERCLCVMLPFRVKTLFAPRRSLIYILAMFTYIIMSHIPIFIIHRFEFENQEGTNVSKLVLTTSHNRDIIHDVIYYTNYFVVSFASVTIVLVCTVITSSHIKTSKAWRRSVSQTVTTKPRRGTDSLNGHQVASPSAGRGKEPKHMTDATIDKETRLVKMITLISIIFLICYTPELTVIVMQYIDERFSEFGQYQRVANLMYSITFFMTALNSSINIFVYYRMSSKYRKEFRKWCLKTDAKNN